MATINAGGKIMRVIGRLVMRLVLLAFAALIVSALVVVVVIPRATHGTALTVLTGSMTPGIPVGSVVVVRPVDPHTLQIGDVATYQVEEGKETFITHRIVKVHGKAERLSFTFKGDANRAADLEPIPAGAVRGEVWFHVPYLGAIRDALHGKGGVTLFGMLILAGYAISQVSAGLRERKTAGLPSQASSTPIRLERAVVLAEFEADLADPDRPVELARQWGGLLVQSSPTTFSILLAPSPAGLEATFDLLRLQRPTRVETWDALDLPPGSPVDLTSTEAPTTEEHGRAQQLA